MPQGSSMTGINYSERIPNNVDLSDNRRLQRALERWRAAARRIAGSPREAADPAALRSRLDALLQAQ